MKLKKILELEKVHQQAMISLYGNFDDNQMAALENFVRSMIELVGLEGTDARVIEGDDDSEIVRY